MKYRSKKDKQQSIVIGSRHWGRKKGEFAFLIEIKASEPLPIKLDYDSRLMRTKLGHSYLCIPKPLEVRLESQKPAFISDEELRGARVIALDPGIRTFQTCFNASGFVTEWEMGDITRIYRLCHVYMMI
jgi:hypothetical protein